MANEYYYNDGKTITSEEAHALKDKSKLIVADREVSKAEQDSILAPIRIMAEEKEDTSVEETTTEEPAQEEVI